VFDIDKINNLHTSMLDKV